MAPGALHRGVSTPTLVQYHIVPLRILKNLENLIVVHAQTGRQTGMADDLVAVPFDKSLPGDQKQDCRLNAWAMRLTDKAGDHCPQICRSPDDRGRDRLPAHIAPSRA